MDLTNYPSLFNFCCRWFSCC